MKNIIVIVGDDLRADWLAPLTKTLSIFSGGTHFLNARATTPQCGPSRATMYTGMLARNHGVKSNLRCDRFDEGASIVVALKGAGYRTGLIGKYINEYSFGKPAYIPQGWDRWFAFKGGQGFYDYNIRDQSVTRHYGNHPSHYSTDVLANQALRFVEDTSSDPYFLWFAPVAPHGPTAAERHKGDPVVLPERSPAYNEPSVADKPPWVRALRAWGAETEREHCRDDRKRTRTLLALDEAVQGIADAVTNTGKANDTVLFFISDNGILTGEHRIRNRKVYPYEEALRIPFFIKQGWADTPESSSDLVFNTDLAPTIAAYAGIEITNVDGASLLPILNREEYTPRESFPIEGPGVPDYDLPSWTGTQYPTSVEIDYFGGEREAYNLDTDPHQLTNIA